MTPLIFLSAKGETADKVRAFRSGAEDYIVKPFDSAELVARVAKALERQARELGASPTTQLPGADAIEAEIDRRIHDQSQPAVCCYLDLDNLKAFNDYYGYAKADGVIRQTGDLMRDIVGRVGAPGDFIGHIAGDDFVLVVSAETADKVCTAICDRFDQLIPLYYNRDDRARGYIEAKDRWGTLRRFPIMTVSIAAVSLTGVGTFAEVAVRAADGKKLAKSLPGSTYVRDGAVIIGGSGTAPANDSGPHPTVTAVET
jgi:diguanylate cyclase (GGDEF)-like protein